MLQIDFLRIGLHILNVLIMFVVLRLLVYKPILKFIKQREHAFSDKTDDLDAREKRLVQQKAQYEHMMAQAQGEAASIIANSNEMAQEHAREILGKAKEHAKEIVVRAKKEIDSEKAQARLDMRAEIADMSVQIAQKVLEREISVEDNRKIIDEFFERVG